MNTCAMPRARAARATSIPLRPPFRLMSRRATMVEQIHAYWLGLDQNAAVS
jgi:hypothetical protein